MADTSAPSSGERGPRTEAPFLQGTVLAWDALAGTNQIRVRGAVLENLQSHLGSETSLIRPLDKVTLIRLNNSFAVLGRIETPGSTQRALGIEYAEIPTLNNPVGTGFETRNAPFVNVYIGSSLRCLVTLSMDIQITNNMQRLGLFVSGSSLIGPIPWRCLAVGTTGTLDMQVSRVLKFDPDDGLNEGMNKFQVMAQTDSLSSLPSVGEVQITVQPF